MKGLLKEVDVQVDALLALGEEPKGVYVGRELCEGASPPTFAAILSSKGYFLNVSFTDGSEVKVY